MFTEASYELFHKNYIQRISQHIHNKYYGKALHIQIPLKEIKKNTRSFIKGQATIGSDRYACLVACGHWSKLQPTRSDVESGQVILFDHLAELVPNRGKKIALLTFQNGINNTLENFMDMGESILEQVPEIPLCIGLYNPTKGLINDLREVSNKLDGILSDTICATHALFATLAEKLKKINPEQLFAHFTHSEGGLIAKKALELDSSNLKSYYQTNLLIATYGAVLPIPKSHARAINTYSTGDFATWPRVKRYLADLGEQAKDYDIKTVAPIRTSTFDAYKDFKFEQRMELLEDSNLANCELTAECLNSAGRVFKGGDHGFQGDTYQTALLENIKDFRRKAAIYDGK